jgi:hypothetical protein
MREQPVPLEEAAQILGVTRQTISNRVKERGLDEWKHPGDRRIYVLLSQVRDTP